MSGEKLSNDQETKQDLIEKCTADLAKLRKEVLGGNDTGTKNDSIKRRLESHAKDKSYVRGMFDMSEQEALEGAEAILGDMEKKVGQLWDDYGLFLKADGETVDENLKKARMDGKMNKVGSAKSAFDSKYTELQQQVESGKITGDQDELILIFTKELTNVFMNEVGGALQTMQAIQTTTGGESTAVRDTLLTQDSKEYTSQTAKALSTKLTDVKNHNKAKIEKSFQDGTKDEYATWDETKAEYGMYGEFNSKSNSSEVKIHTIIKEKSDEAGLDDADQIFMDYTRVTNPSILADMQQAVPGAKEDGTTSFQVVTGFDQNGDFTYILKGSGTDGAIKEQNGISYPVGIRPYVYDKVVLFSKKPLDAIKTNLGEREEREKTKKEAELGYGEFLKGFPEDTAKVINEVIKEKADGDTAEEQTLSRLVMTGLNTIINRQTDFFVSYCTTHGYTPDRREPFSGCNRDGNLVDLNLQSNSGGPDYSPVFMTQALLGDELGDELGEKIYDAIDGNWAGDIVNFGREGDPLGSFQTYLGQRFSTAYEAEKQTTNPENYVEGLDIDRGGDTEKAYMEAQLDRELENIAQRIASGEMSMPESAQPFNKNNGADIVGLRHYIDFQKNVGASDDSVLCFENGQIVRDPDYSAKTPSPEMTELQAILTNLNPDHEKLESLIDVNDNTKKICAYMNSKRGAIYKKAMKEKMETDAGTNGTIDIDGETFTKPDFETATPEDLQKRLTETTNAYKETATGTLNEEEKVQLRIVEERVKEGLNILADTLANGLLEENPDLQQIIPEAQVGDGEMSGTKKLASIEQRLDKQIQEQQTIIKEKQAKGEDTSEEEEKLSNYEGLLQRTKPYHELASGYFGQISTLEGKNVFGVASSDETENALESGEDERVNFAIELIPSKLRTIESSASTPEAKCEALTTYYIECQQAIASNKNKSDAYKANAARIVKELGEQISTKIQNYISEDMGTKEEGSKVMNPDMVKHLIAVTMVMRDKSDDISSRSLLQYLTMASPFLFLNASRNMGIDNGFKDIDQAQKNLEFINFGPGGAYDQQKEQISDPAVYEGATDKRVELKNKVSGLFGDKVPDIGEVFGGVIPGFSSGDGQTDIFTAPYHTLSVQQKLWLSGFDRLTKRFTSDELQKMIVTGPDGNPDPTNLISALTEVFDHTANDLMWQRSKTLDGSDLAEPFKSSFSAYRDLRGDRGRWDLSDKGQEKAGKLGEMVGVIVAAIVLVAITVASLGTAAPATMSTLTAFLGQYAGIASIAAKGILTGVYMKLVGMGLGHGYESFGEGVRDVVSEGIMMGAVSVATLGLGNLMSKPFRLLLSKLGSPIVNAAGDVVVGGAKAMARTGLKTAVGVTQRGLNLGATTGLFTQAMNMKQKIMTGEWMTDDEFSDAMAEGLLLGIAMGTLHSGGNKNPLNMMERHGLQKMKEHCERYLKELPEGPKKAKFQKALESINKELGVENREVDKKEKDKGPEGNKGEKVAENKTDTKTEVTIESIVSKFQKNDIIEITIDGKITRVLKEGSTYTVRFNESTFKFENNIMTEQTFMKFIKETKGVEKIKTEKFEEVMSKTEIVKSTTIETKMTKEQIKAKEEALNKEQLELQKKLEKLERAEFDINNTKSSNEIKTEIEKAEARLDEIIKEKTELLKQEADTQLSGPDKIEGNNSIKEGEDITTKEVARSFVAKRTERIKTASQAMKQFLQKIIDIVTLKWLSKERITTKQMERFNKEIDKSMKTLDELKQQKSELQEQELQLKDNQTTVQLQAEYVKVMKEISKVNTKITIENQKIIDLELTNFKGSRLQNIWEKVSDIVKSKKTMTETEKKTITDEIDTGTQTEKTPAGKKLGQRIKDFFKDLVTASPEKVEALKQSKLSSQFETKTMEKWISEQKSFDITNIKAENISGRIQILEGHRNMLQKRIETNKGGKYQYIEENGNSVLQREVGGKRENVTTDILEPNSITRQKITEIEAKIKELQSKKVERQTEGVENGVVTKEGKTDIVVDGEIVTEKNIGSKTENVVEKGKDAIKKGNTAEITNQSKKINLLLRGLKGLQAAGKVTLETVAKVRRSAMEFLKSLYKSKKSKEIEETIKETEKTMKETDPSKVNEVESIKRDADMTSGIDVQVAVGEKIKIDGVEYVKTAENTYTTKGIPHEFTISIVDGKIEMSYKDLTLTNISKPYEINDVKIVNEKGAERSINDIKAETKTNTVDQNVGSEFGIHTNVDGKIPGLSIQFEGLGKALTNLKNRVNSLASKAKEALIKRIENLESQKKKIREEVKPEEVVSKETKAKIEELNKQGKELESQIVSEVTKETGNKSSTELTESTTKTTENLVQNAKEGKQLPKIEVKILEVELTSLLARPIDINSMGKMQKLVQQAKLWLREKLPTAVKVLYRNLELRLRSEKMKVINKAQPGDIIEIKGKVDGKAVSMIIKKTAVEHWQTIDGSFLGMRGKTDKLSFDANGKPVLGEKTVGDANWSVRFLQRSGEVVPTVRQLAAKPGATFSDLLIRPDITNQQKVLIREYDGANATRKTEILKELERSEIEAKTDIGLRDVVEKLTKTAQNESIVEATKTGDIEKMIDTRKDTTLSNKEVLTKADLEAAINPEKPNIDLLYSKLQGVKLSITVDGKTVDLRLAIHNEILKNCTTRVDVVNYIKNNPRYFSANNQALVTHISEGKPIKTLQEKHADKPGHMGTEGFGKLIETIREVDAAHIQMLTDYNTNVATMSTMGKQFFFEFNKETILQYTNMTEAQYNTTVNALRVIRLNPITYSTQASQNIIGPLTLKTQYAQAA